MLPLFGGIGLFYLVFNIGAILTSRKLQKEGSDHHVSGIPFLGGIHILIAGLISPIKWLALLCVLDYTFWSFLYAVFSSEPSRRTRTQKRNEEGLHYDVIILCRTEGQPLDEKIYRFINDRVLFILV